MRFERPAISYCCSRERIGVFEIERMYETSASLTALSGLARARNVILVAQCLRNRVRPDRTVSDSRSSK